MPRPWEAPASRGWRRRASLLALVAFERALALRERPRSGTGAALALAAAGAVLTHYLAAFPVAALALLAIDARPAARRAFAFSGLAAAVLAAPWVPVALRQPPASMAWTRGPEFAAALVGFPANLAFGVEPAGAPALPLAILGGARTARARSAGGTSPARRLRRSGCSGGRTTRSAR